MPSTTWTENTEFDFGSEANASAPSPSNVSPPPDAGGTAIERRVIVNPTPEEMQRLRAEFGIPEIPTETFREVRKFENGSWVGVTESGGGAEQVANRIITAIRAVVFLGFAAIGTTIGYLDSSIGPTWGALSGLAFGLLCCQVNVTRRVSVKQV